MTWMGGPRGLWRFSFDFPTILKPKSLDEILIKTSLYVIIRNKKIKDDGFSWFFIFHRKWIHEYTLCLKRLVRNKLKVRKRREVQYCSSSSSVNRNQIWTGLHQTLLKLASLTRDMGESRIVLRNQTLWKSPYDSGIL